MDNQEKAALFEQTAALKKASAKAICNWILGDITRYMNETGKLIADTKLSSEKLSYLIECIESGKISNTSGKIVFEIILIEDRDIDEIIKEKSLAQISDESALNAIVEEVLKNNQKSVDDYNAGKTNALGFLVGQCMKASKGKGNPAKMKELLLEYISR